ncbi:hypothetical protein J2R98_002896 [Alkalibacillus filiformis]|uniref:Uncharacterized protein n=1 Tax=Alkalibacillus filiformis TaxID=200990 RepID=A0ABU0DY44_9BACI|nr:hypothetical protein [Alkalibacillus filiformis]MDQ0353035.1 hypothetical protein [Alkalibacillus filiformis]
MLSANLLMDMKGEYLRWTVQNGAMTSIFVNAIKSVEHNDRLLLIQFEEGKHYLSLDLEHHLKVDQIKTDDLITYTIQYADNQKDFILLEIPKNLSNTREGYIAMRLQEYKNKQGSTVDFTELKALKEQWGKEFDEALEEWKRSN